mgnify:CR=1 FL=1
MHSSHLSLSEHSVKRNAEEVVLSIDRFINELFAKSNINEKLSTAAIAFAQNDNKLAELRNQIIKYRDIHKQQYELIKKQQENNSIHLDSNLKE